MYLLRSVFFDIRVRAGGGIGLNPCQSLKPPPRSLSPPMMHLPVHLSPAAQSFFTCTNFPFPTAQISTCPKFHLPTCSPIFQPITYLLQCTSQSIFHLSNSLFTCPTNTHLPSTFLQTSSPTKLFLFTCLQVGH